MAYNVSMSATVDIRLNGSARTIPASGAAATVADLIRSLDIGDRRVAVEVNGAVVPRAIHAEHVLADGDRVEVVTFVGGG